MAQAWRYPVLLVGCFLIFSLLTSIHLVSRHTKFTSDRTDTLLHLWFYEDYGSYLSVITMGQAGHLFYRDVYRTDQQILTPNHILYTVAGLITRPFKIWPPYVYHGLKIGLCAWVIFSLYNFSVALFKSKKWASIVTVLILFFPVLPLPIYSQEVAQSFTPWWNALSVIGRFDLRPHQLFGLGCLLSSLGWFFIGKTRKNLFYSSLFLSLGTWVFVYAVIPALLIIGVALLMSWRFQRSHYERLFGLIIVPCLCFFLFMILMKANVVFQTEPLWSVDFWRRDPFFFKHLYGTYLVYLVFALSGLAVALYEKRYTFLLFGLWFLLPLIFAPFTDITHISWGRLLHFSIHIPLVLLSIPLFQFLQSSNLRIINAIFLICFLLISGLAIFKEGELQWNNTLTEFISDKYYPPTSTYESLAYVGSLVGTDARILTDFETSIPLIAFNPVQTYVGEYGYAPYTFDTTLKNQPLTPEFLETKRIQYILERQPLSYPFLQNIWEGNGYFLYKVKDS